MIHCILRVMDDLLRRITALAADRSVVRSTTDTMPASGASVRTQASPLRAEETVRMLRAHFRGNTSFLGGRARREVH